MYETDMVMACSVAISAIAAKHRFVQRLRDRPFRTAYTTPRLSTAKRTTHSFAPYATLACRARLRPHASITPMSIPSPSSTSGRGQNWARPSSTTAQPRLEASE
ncbi:hypothetical protein A4X06_0g9301 [Tilletia controversa]|uniref:Uncharacterized protein n=1 Tax=Tilletia controversa TaxID=13291 RepID=A0A8X7MIS4_9BASI|nr:hypothetical protein A4X06_0g9301 [Tilletia controversa]